MHGLLDTLQFVHKMPVDVIKFIVAVQNCLMRCGGCNIIDFYNGSCQDDVTFMFSSKH